MDKEQVELYQTNDDIIFILNNCKQIGWRSVKEQSLYRILYLSKVLYSFVNNDEPNIFNYYHFTTTESGPYSGIISQSIADLASRQWISNQDSGLLLEGFENLKVILDFKKNDNKKRKQDWLKVVILLLGKYGESKIFSFTINDPLYKESTDSNSRKEISFDNSENKTLEVLNSFKSAFESNIQDTSSISKEEYLEFYFDFIFSQIIK